ncbi:MAG: hypothetical protein AB7V50_06995, partial [Vampirovibrionia bacterium]
IIRHKLTALEMAEQLMRRKEIYEIKYPEATRSAIATKMMEQNSKHFMGSAETALPMKSFVEDTALNIGKSKRTVHDYIKIAVGIPQEIRDLIKGTTLEDRLTDLLKLSRIEDTERQRALVERIINGEANTLVALLRKDKLANNDNLPDLTKPTVPTNLFKRIYNQFIDLQIKYSNLELENEKLKAQIAS